MKEEQNVTEEIEEIKPEAVDDTTTAAAANEPEASEGAAEETWDHKRGRKRAASPDVKEEQQQQLDASQMPSSPKRARPDNDVCIITHEEVPFDQSLVVLDWCKFTKC